MARIMRLLIYLFALLSGLITVEMGHARAAEPATQGICAVERAAEAGRATSHDAQRPAPQTHQRLPGAMPARPRMAAPVAWQSPVERADILLT